MPTKTTIQDHRWLYLRCRISAEAPLDDTLVMSAISAKLQVLFGLVGASITIDLLKLQDDLCFLRTDYTTSQMLTASLPVISEIDGLPARFQILKASPFLTHLA